MLRKPHDWIKNFVHFYQPTVDIGPGSCLGVALDTYKPLASAAKKARDYAKDYVAPLAASLPVEAVQLEEWVRTSAPRGSNL
jgi:hypothetical protein